MSTNPPPAHVALIQVANFGSFSVPIKWSNRSQYLIGKLDVTPKISDFNEGGAKFLSSLCDYLWATQHFDSKKGERARFVSPEELVEFVTAENCFELAETFLRAYTAAHSTDDQKKT